jgi:hypothetical protein
MKPDMPRSAAFSLNELSSKEHNFEAVFQVSPSHHLVAVRSRNQGGATTKVTWEHDEYDASGRLVAHYKSFEQVNADGKRHCGWQKFDVKWQLLDEQ